MFDIGLDSLKQLYDGVPIYLALVTFGHETKVVQRLTNKFQAVESAFGMWIKFYHYSIRFTALLNNKL